MTSSINANLTEKEKGLKPDEIAKRNNQKKKRKVNEADHVQSIPNPTSQINMQQPLPQINVQQPYPNISIPIPFHFQSQHLSVSEQWNAGMSPYHYEIVALPNNVQKC